MHILEHQGSQVFWISESSVQSTMTLTNPDSLLGVQERLHFKLVFSLGDDLAIRHVHIISFHIIFSSANSLCYYSAN